MDSILENDILLSKKYKVGSVYMIGLPGDMFAVVSANDKADVIYSRSFFYNESTKKKITLECKRCFRQICGYLAEKNIEAIEEMDFC